MIKYSDRSEPGSAEIKGFASPVGTMSLGHLHLGKISVSGCRSRDFGIFQTNLEEHSSVGGREPLPSSDSVRILHVVIKPEWCSPLRFLCFQSPRHIGRALLPLLQLGLDFSAVAGKERVVSPNLKSGAGTNKSY